MRRKRTETTIEAHQLFVIRKPGNSVLEWCPACSTETRMVAPEVAAILCGVNALTVYRWVEAGLVHFAETYQGALLVCLNSLPIGANAEKVGAARFDPMNSEGEKHE